MEQIEVLAKEANAPQKKLIIWKTALEKKDSILKEATAIYQEALRKIGEAEKAENDVIEVEASGKVLNNFAARLKQALAKATFSDVARRKRWELCVLGVDSTANQQEWIAKEMRMKAEILTEEALPAILLMVQTTGQTKSKLEKVFADAQTAIATLSTECPLWESVLERNKRIVREEGEARLHRKKMYDSMVQAQENLHKTIAAAREALKKKQLEAQAKELEEAGVSSRVKRIL